MQYINIILIPLIAAFIGWLTNYIAVKMLFHPKKPVRFLGITLQGIFPKRQHQFAAKLGAVVSNELLHMDEITQQLKDPGQFHAVRPFIVRHVDHFLQERLKEKLPVLSVFVGTGTLEKIKEGLLEEIDELMPVLIAQFADNLSGKFDVERIVSEKVAAFSSDKLEEILVAIMSREFRFVEILGGVLGFVIGIVQVLLTLI